MLRSISQIDYWADQITETQLLYAPPMCRKCSYMQSLAEFAADLQFNEQKIRLYANYDVNICK